MPLLPEIRLQAWSHTPRATTLLGPPSCLTPRTAAPSAPSFAPLGMAAVPARLVPMKLPSTVEPVPTAAPWLPEIRLHGSVQTVDPAGRTPPTWSDCGDAVPVGQGGHARRRWFRCGRL